jgi:hypothetical protein
MKPLLTINSSKNYEYLSSLSNPIVNLVFKYFKKKKCEKLTLTPPVHIIFCFGIVLCNMYIYIYYYNRWTSTLMFDLIANRRII